jgi:hypothetical protein
MGGFIEQMNKLNYFTLSPIGQITKENGLTKAYLALLRLSPQAMNHFLNLVDRKLPVSRLPPLNQLSAQLSTVLTQVTSIPQSTGTLLSILLRHANTQKPHDIVWSERQPVYDGLICFDPSIILTIETKFRDIGDLTQLNPAISSFHDEETQQIIKSDPNPYNNDLKELPDSVKLYQYPIILEWPEILNGLCDLYLAGSLDNKCSGPLSNIEATLFQDFFDFIQTNFHHYGLGPYSNLKICNHIPILVQRRCDSILGEIAKNLPSCQTELAYSKSDGWYISLEKESVKRLRLCYLDDSKSIRLGFYLGDTVNQARNLFGKADLTNVREFNDPWRAKPNLHFSYSTSHLIWPDECCNRLGLETYLDYWANHQDSIRQWKSNEWPKLMEELQKSGQVNQADLNEFEVKFKKRRTMNLCPGVALEYHWTLNEASTLDDKNQFIEAVMKKSEKVLKSVP